MCFAISYWSAGKSSGGLIFNISKSAAVQMVAFKKLYKDCTLETSVEVLCVEVPCDFSQLSVCFIYSPHSHNE